MAMFKYCWVWEHNRAVNFAQAPYMPLKNVEDVVVFGQDHSITGKMVVAKFKLKTPETRKELKARMLAFCKNKIQSYKVPGKIVLTDETTYNERFKRMRRVKKELD